MSTDYPPHHLIWMVIANGTSMPVLEPVISPPRLLGKLTITVKKAKKLWDAARIGKMDPFCELKVGEEKKRTAVHKKGDVEPVWEEKLEFQLTGEESSLRLRVHNKTLLSSSLIGTARLPLDTLVVLHACSSGLGLQPPSSSNVDSHTFWAEIGRESRQSVFAGAVLLSVDSFAWDREEDRRAMTEALARKVDRRTSLPSILRADAHTTRENSQNEGERERKDRSASLTGEPSPFVATEAQPAAAHSPLPASASFPTPGLSAPGVEKKSTLASPHPRGALSAYPSNSSSASSPRVSSSQVSSSPHSRQSSLPPAPKLRLFGGPLSNGIARSKSCVPVVVYVCVQYLIYHGLRQEGLFRISSSSLVVDAMKAAFESGDSVNISEPHATANVLKCYFRELAEPLVPFSAFARFAAATDSRDLDASYAKLRDCVNSLDEDNRVVLSFLLHFLTLVAAQQAVNRMSARNLAVVWAPNLIRGPNSNPELAAPDAHAMAREMKMAEECIVMMIEGYQQLFPEGPPRPFHLDHPQKERPQVATPRMSATKVGDRVIKGAGKEERRQPTKKDSRDAKQLRK